MGAIVAATHEMTIGAIRLIWWRDALARLDDRAARIPDEPLLAAIAATLLPLGLSGAKLSGIEEGWAALLDEDEPSETAMLRHAEQRGGRLFALASELLGEARADAAEAGAGWALAELGHRLRSQEARGFARQEAARRLAAIKPAQWSGALQPLGLLILLAKADAATPLDRQRRQGSPQRLLRGLAFKIFGR